MHDKNEKNRKSIAEKLSPLNELNSEQKNALEEYKQKEVIRRQKGKKYSIIQAIIGLGIIIFALVWIPSIPIDGGDDSTAMIFALLLFTFLVNIAVYMNRIGFGGKGRLLMINRVVAKYDTPEQKHAKYLINKILVYTVIILAVIALAFVYLS